MYKIDKKRLSVDIRLDLHDELKEMAKKYNVTITNIVVDLIQQTLIQNRDYDKAN